MSSPINELKVLIGEPDWLVPEIDWVRVEDEIGLSLPLDYKMLVDLYPPLSFDYFLEVHHPGMPGMKNLQECAADTLEGARLLRDEGDFDEIPYPLYPEEDGLYPWARTANSDSVFWRTLGAPELWTIVVAGRSYQQGDWWEFKGSTTEFLLGVISRRVRCPVITETFPSPDPVIYQYPRDRLEWY